MPLATQRGGLRQRSAAPAPARGCRPIRSRWWWGPRVRRSAATRRSRLNRVVAVSANRHQRRRQTANDNTTLRVPVIGIRQHPPGSASADLVTGEVAAIAAEAICMAIHHFAASSLATRQATAPTPRAGSGWPGLRSSHWLGPRSRGSGPRQSVDQPFQLDVGVAARGWPDALKLAP